MEKDEDCQEKLEDLEKYIQIKAILTKTDIGKDGIPNAHFEVNTSIHIDKINPIVALKLARVIKNEAISVEQQVLDRILEQKEK
jgi:hypothetical protein